MTIYRRYQVAAIDAAAELGQVRVLSGATGKNALTNFKQVR
jgi:hypothetical protein